MSGPFATCATRVFYAFKVTGGTAPARYKVANELLKLSAMAMIGVREFEDYAISYFTPHFDGYDWDLINEKCTAGPTYRYGTDPIQRKFATVVIN